MSDLIFKCIECYKPLEEPGTYCSEQCAHSNFAYDELPEDLLVEDLSDGK